jgi:hypothetical protein
MGALDLWHVAIFATCVFVPLALGIFITLIVVYMRRR